MQDGKAMFDPPVTDPPFELYTFRSGRCSGEAILEVKLVSLPSLDAYIIGCVICT